MTDRAPRPDIDGIFLPDKAVCELCGEPMPAGEEMFQFHGYSGPCPKPPMRAPRPEGMSELRLAEITARVANLIDHGAHICVDYLPDASSSFNTITCNRCGYSSEIHDIRDLLADHARLRADGATLREELVSGRAQWQQERDEYRQIVESSETALATLRERVKKLPSPNDVLTDGQLAWWLSHATQKVTRVEVIAERGRAFTRWDCHLEHTDSMFQDDGRTLKLFVKGGTPTSPPAQGRRTAAVNKLPSIEEMAGSVSDLTGGQTLEEFMRRLRDE